MDPKHFFSSSNVLIVAGKGGVGKSTVAATIATAASQTGLSVLLVEVSGRSATAPMFGAQAQGYDEAVVIDEADHDDQRGRVSLRSITPDDALTEWLNSHGFGRLVTRLSSVGILDVIATATPGIRDLLVLGRIKALEQEGVADLIVVDAPAAGHAVGFLRSPVGVRDAARSGVLNRQANEILELMGDPKRCQVVLVTIAEETPINELIETSFAIEDELGVRLGPVVVNALLDELDGLSPTSPSDLPPAADGLEPADLDALRLAATFRHERQQLQASQLTRLEAQLPLDQLHLPMVFSPVIGTTERELLAQHLNQQITERVANDPEDHQGTTP